MSAPTPLEQRESRARPAPKDTPAAPSPGSRSERRAAEGMTPDAYDRQVDPNRQPGFEEQERARRPEGTTACGVPDGSEGVEGELNTRAHLRELVVHGDAVASAVTLTERAADDALRHEHALAGHAEAVDRAIRADSIQRSGAEDILSIVESLLSFLTATKNAFVVLRGALRGPSLTDRHVAGLGHQGLLGVNKGFEIADKVGAPETPQAILALRDQGNRIAEAVRSHGSLITELTSMISTDKVRHVHTTVAALHDRLPHLRSPALRADVNQGLEAAAARSAHAEAALRAVRVRIRASQVHGSADVIPGAHKRTFLDRVMAHATASDCGAPLLLAQVHRKVVRLDPATMEVIEEGTSSDGMAMLASANQKDIEGLQAGPARRVDATHWGLALDYRDAALLRPELDAVTLERDDQVEVHFGLVRVVDAKDWQDATRREALIARWRSDLGRQSLQGPEMKEGRR